jgi:hypothetical protein
MHQTIEYQFFRKIWEGEAGVAELHRCWGLLREIPGRRKDVCSDLHETQTGQCSGRILIKYQ